MRASFNKVVSVLVVWAVIVTIWMVVLSINGSWNQCDSDSRANVVQQSFEFYEERQPPATPGAVSSEATSTEATHTLSDPVHRQRLAQYFSKIMQTPDSVGVSSAKQAVEENCTAVILTYKLAKTLSKVISHYCKVPFLQTIYVVWNNVNETINFPLKIWESKCTSSEVKFVKPDANRLINRYSLWKRIKTNCKYHCSHTIVQHAAIRQHSTK